MDNMFFQYDNWMKVCLPKSLYKRLIRHCQKVSTKETGGILFGQYSEDLSSATIAEVTGAPIGSLKRNFSFYRSTRGIAKLLDIHWNENQYYLGEWHYHPSSSANPSSVDIKQLRKFSNNKKLKCPEPIMIIVGGNNIMGWKVSVHVFRQDSLLHLE